MPQMTDPRFGDSTDLERIGAELGAAIRRDHHSRSRRRTTMRLAVAGAVVAGVAMFGPSCLLVYAAAHAWHRTAGAAWRMHVERALAPMAIGLTFASAIALMRGTEHGWAAYAITTVATVVLSLTEVNPLIVLGGGAITLVLTGS